MSRHVMLLVTGVSLLVTSNVLAYCRTTTCAQQKADGSMPEECVPGIYEDNCQLAGTPLHWEKKCTSFSVHVGGSTKLGITADELQAMGTEAFHNWLDVDCPEGGKPNFHVETYPQVECDEVRYNQDARNQNLWVFRDEFTFDETSVVALTTTRFPSEGENKGKLYDVDIEFNSYEYEFAADSSVSDYDYNLMAVVQHETGHVLGLADTDNQRTILYRRYDSLNEDGNLAADDVAGVCAVYPPVDDPASSCDAEPRHGFSRQCNEAVDEAGCSCTVIGRNGKPRGGSLLAAILGLALAQSRRKWPSLLRKSRVFGNQGC